MSNNLKRKNQGYSSAVRRFEITEKFYSSKALLKMAGGGVHPPHPPLDPPLPEIPSVYNLPTKLSVLNCSSVGSLPLLTPSPVLLISTFCLQIAFLLVDFKSDYFF